MSKKPRPRKAAVAAKAPLHIALPDQHSEPESVEEAREPVRSLPAKPAMAVTNEGIEFRWIASIAGVLLVWFVVLVAALPSFVDFSLDRNPDASLRQAARAAEASDSAWLASTIDHVQRTVPYDFSTLLDIAGIVFDRAKQDPSESRDIVLVVLRYLHASIETYEATRGRDVYTSGWNEGAVLNGIATGYELLGSEASSTFARMAAFRSDPVRTRRLLGEAVTKAGAGAMTETPPAGTTTLWTASGVLPPPGPSDRMSWQQEAAPPELLVYRRTRLSLNLPKSFVSKGAPTLVLAAKADPATGVWPYILIEENIGGVRSPLGFIEVASPSWVVIEVPLVRSITPGAVLELLYANDARDPELNQDRNVSVCWIALRSSE